VKPHAVLREIKYGFQISLIGIVLMLHPCGVTTPSNAKLAIVLFGPL